jgi:hypothetical protein
MNCCGISISRSTGCIGSVKIHIPLLIALTVVVLFTFPGLHSTSILGGISEGIAQMYIMVLSQFAVFAVFIQVSKMKNEARSTLLVQSSRTWFPVSFRMVVSMLPFYQRLFTLSFFYLRNLFYLTVSVKAEIQKNHRRRIRFGRQF